MRFSSVQVDSRALLSFMRKKGMRPVEVAEKSGVSERSVYRMLRGKRVRIATLKAVAIALDVPVDMLIAVERGWQE